MSYDLPSSWDVYRWPEFIAFAKRLGIPLEFATTDLIIRLPYESTVEVIYTFQGEDMNKGGTEDRELRRKQVAEWEKGFNKGESELDKASET